MGTDVLFVMAESSSAERSPIRSFTSYVPEISPAFVSGVGLPFQFWLLGAPRRAGLRRGAVTSQRCYTAALRMQDTSMKPLVISYLASVLNAMFQLQSLCWSGGMLKWRALPFCRSQSHLRTSLIFLVLICCYTETSKYYVSPWAPPWGGVTCLPHKFRDSKTVSRVCCEERAVYTKVRRQNAGHLSCMAKLAW